jgi:hypothetical protein
MKYDKVNGVTGRYDFVKDIKSNGYMVDANDIHKVKYSGGKFYFVAKNALKAGSFNIQKFTPSTGKLDFVVTDLDLDDANENLTNVINAGL